jgi:hypothetical protein
MFIFALTFPKSIDFNSFFFSFQNLSRKNELSALAPSGSSTSVYSHFTCENITKETGVKE